MALKISNKYDDIIHLPRPESKHPHMSNSDRAKIFSPFAALKGHIEAIHEKETPRVNRIDLSEEMAAVLNKKLLLLEKDQHVSVTFFISDPGPDGSGGTAEGMYLTLSGIIRRIDSITRILEIDDYTHSGIPDVKCSAWARAIGYKINFDDILDITPEPSTEISL